MGKLNAKEIADATIAAFDDIEYAIETMGTEIESDVPVSEYDDKILKIYSSIVDTIDDAFTEIKANTEAISELQESAVYSNTPKQVGIWIDGTPIWRIAFEVSVEGDVNINIPLCCKGNGVRLIDCDCLSMASGLGDTYNRKTEIAFSGGMMNISYENDVGDAFLYGWVEFISSEDNLYNSQSIDYYFAPYKQIDGTYKLTGNDLNNIIIPVPVEYVGNENVQFTVLIDTADGQDVDLAYGDSTGIKLNSFIADGDTLTLSNMGYPVAADSYFIIRCHTAVNEYLILKELNIKVVE